MNRVVVCLLALACARCADSDVAVLAIADDMRAAILIAFEEPEPTLRALDPSTPLRIDDTEVPLALLGFRSPLPALSVVVDEQGRVPVASLDDAGAWPLPQTDDRAAHPPDARATIEARVAALRVPRPACSPATGYALSELPVPSGVRRVQSAYLDRDRVLVALQAVDGDGPIVTATATVWLMPHFGAPRRLARTFAMRSDTDIAAVREDRARWLVVGDPTETRLFAIDEDDELGPPTTIAGAVDVTTIQVLSGGAWLGLLSSPPTLLLRARGAAAWETLSTRAHPQPRFAERCRQVRSRASLSVDEDGAVWAGISALGLVRFDGARVQPWPDTEPPPEVGPHCESRRARLSGGADMLFTAAIDPSGRLDGVVWWRPQPTARWARAAIYTPNRVFEDRGRVVTVSSNARLIVHEYAPSRPELPPRLCDQPSLVSTRDGLVDGQIVAVGEDDGVGANDAKIRVQWVELP